MIVPGIPLFAASSTVNVSSPSATRSPVIGMLTGACVAPGANVNETEAPV